MPTIARVLPALQHEKLYAELSAHGWVRQAATVAAGGTPVAESTWRYPGVDAAVSWMDDTAFSQHFYGLVYGPQAAEALLRLARDAWLISPAKGISSLQEATTVEHLGTAARALGVLACGPFDQDVFDVLCAMLASGNPVLQMDALIAVALSAWPQFEVKLQQMLEVADLAPEVRAEVLEVLQVQQDSAWNFEFR